MANLPISGLTASASNLASTDLAPVVQTVGVGPVKMTGLQLAGGLLGSTTFNGATSAGTALGTVTITGTGGQFSCAAATLAVGQNVTISGTLGGTGSITGYSSPTTYTISATNGSTTFTLVNASTGAALTTTAGTPTGLTYVVTSPVVNFTQTWNNSNVTFTGLKFNATDTASNANSLLLDMGTGGGSYVSKFTVDKVGVATSRTTLATSSYTVSGGYRILDNAGGGIKYSLFYSDATSRKAGFFTATDSTAWPGFVFSVSSGMPQMFSLSEAVNNGGGICFPNGLTIGNQSVGTIPANSVALTGNTATLQLGAADTTDTTAPTPQFLRVQSWSSSTNNNQLGADFTIQGSRGTGTGAGGSIIFQVAPASVTPGTAQNAYSTALTLNSSQQLIVASTTTVDSGSVPGIYFGSSNFGIRYISSGTFGGFGFSVNGTFPKIILGNNSGTNIVLPANGGLSWSSSDNTPYGTIDTYLLRGGAANVIAIGGTTSSFPALKRSATGVPLQVRLADDSGDAAFQCGTQTAGGTAFNVNGTGGNSIASVTNTTTGTLLQVLNSTSNPLMTVTDTTSGTLFSVQSTTAATLFSVNDTTSGTLLAVTNSSSTDVFTVADTGAATINGATSVGNTKLTVVGVDGLPSSTYKGVASFYDASNLSLSIGGQQNSTYLQCLDARSGNLSTYAIFLNPQGGNVGVGYFGGGTGVYQPGATLTIVSTGSFGWDSGSAVSGVADVTLYRDAANTLALRNGTSAQAFRVYNTFTSFGSGTEIWERGAIEWSSNVLRIATSAGANGGSVRPIEVQVGTGRKFSFTTVGSFELFDSATRESYQGWDAFTVRSDAFIGWASSTSVSQSQGDTNFIRTGVAIIGVRGANTTTGGALSFIEQTAPAAPAANGVYIYAEDNGSGKTRLMALFATGAAQQIAIEP